MNFHRAASDRQGHAGGARAQVGGRHGGMNDAPLNNKVRVASSPSSMLQKNLKEKPPANTIRQMAARLFLAIFS